MKNIFLLVSNQEIVMALPFGSSASEPIAREREVALRWKKSLRTLQRMRQCGLVPPWFRIGRTVYYRMDDVYAFERSRLEGAE